MRMVTTVVLLALVIVLALAVLPALVVLLALFIIFTLSSNVVIFCLLSVITSRIVVTNGLMFLMLARPLVPVCTERTREELSRVG